MLHSHWKVQLTTTTHIMEIYPTCTHMDTYNKHSLNAWYIHAHTQTPPCTQTLKMSRWPSVLYKNNLHSRGNSFKLPLSLHIYDNLSDKKVGWPDSSTPDLFLLSDISPNSDKFSAPLGLPALNLISLSSCSSLRYTFLQCAFVWKYCWRT